MTLLGKSEQGGRDYAPGVEGRVVDAETLVTLGQFPVGKNVPRVGFKAHGKIDPATGDWLLAGQQFGPSMEICTDRRHLGEV